MPSGARALIAATAAALATVVPPARADPLDDDVLEARQVIVTAPSVDGTARTTPHGVSVITAAEIERSTATSLGELLGREANLNLRSFSGSDKGATIDIRGMGDTASSNVLVLLDGVRLNENDLSGADLSVVPLSQIQRIEIIRGGSAVRHGNGAVGGVINIITRRAQPGLASLDVLARVGSYQTRDLGVNAGASKGAWSGNINASTRNTNGYRQNGFVNANNVAAELRWLPEQNSGLADAYLRLAHHEDTAGLPGPVSAQALNGSEAQRRASNAPYDQGSTTVQRVTAGGMADFGRAGQLAIQATFQNRENPYFIGFNPAVPPDAQRSLIESRRVDVGLRYSVAINPLGLPQTLEVGIDGQQANYGRSENGENIVDSSTRRIGQVASSGVWAATTLALSPVFALNAGLRGDWWSAREQSQSFTSGDCQTVTTIVQVDVDPGPGVVLVPVPVLQQVGCSDAYRTVSNRYSVARNRGVEVGLTWQPTARLTAFGSYTRNFRNPNVDELLFASQDLRPQTGRTLEAGVRVGLGNWLEGSATVFQMVIDDEILFGRDPNTGLAVNRNSEVPTRRTGAELELRWRARPAITLRGSVGFVIARFEGPGTYVPLVPRTTASAELLWSPADWLRGSFSARYVGNRYDGNDPSNDRYPVLPSYVVCDLAMSVPRGRWLWSAVVSNLLNAVYSTVGYSATYYPMAGRSLYLEARYRF